jgi:electron transport complex protein RnfC
VLVLSREDIEDPRPEMPCIRCGDCATACPSKLLPQQLLWHLRARNPERAADQGLFDCIECGCCDLVCPSLIPLTSQFRDAKAGMRQQAAEAARAAAAGERHDARQRRLARESAETARRHEARRAGATSPDAVAAALERARAKRAALDEDRSP